MNSNRHNDSKNGSNESEVTINTEIQKIDDYENSVEMKTIDNLEIYIHNQNLLNRLDRLERLIKERQDIVHSYNLQQRDEKPVQDVIKG